jgi:hypothetical protein
MAFNLKLDSNHDIIIGRGTTRTSGLDYTMQLTKTRLLTLLGEWKANPTLGLPWFSEVMIKTPDLSLIEGLILDCIKQTPHVLDVTNITLALDTQTRILTVSFEAISDWGTFNSTVAVTGGA